MANFLVINEIGAAIVDAFRTFLGFLCKIIYPLIIDAWNLFLALSKAELFNSEGEGIVSDMYAKVGLVLGLFMLFRVIFSLFQMFLNPDTLTDKEKGIGGIAKRAIVVIILLAMTPKIFGWAFELQKIIIEDGVIAKFILGTDMQDNSDEQNVKKFGSVLSYNLLRNFYVLDSYDKGAASEACPFYTLTFAELYDYGTLDLIDILATYSGVELTGATVEGEAIIENGQVTGLKLVSNSGDDEYGNTIHYEAELKFGAIGEGDIINITAPSETAGDEFKAQFITGKLDGTGDVEITVTSEYADDSVKIVFYDDVVLMYLPVIEEVDGVETITSYTPSNGYVYREGKVIPFVLAEGADGFMVTSPSAAIEATSLTEVIRPFDLSPRVIEETGTNTYDIIDGVYNYGEAFPFTTYTPYATDIVINTDETHITSIVSDYTMWMAVGQETITYKYDNVAIDEALLTLIKGVSEWTTPTSWFTEDIDVYNTLVSILGEKGVAKIPYIFKEALTGNWGTSVAAGSLQLYNDGYYYDEVWMETPDLSQAFLAEFMEALVENGFTRQEDYTDEDWYGDTIVYAVFTDETGIRVEVDLTNDLYNGGIYIFAPEA